jgi:hypothetical protein
MYPALGGDIRVETRKQNEFKLFHITGRVFLFLSLSVFHLYFASLLVEKKLFSNSFLPFSNK